jgi:T5orf172 domain
MKDDIGHVYLLSNPALGGIVKIGHTKRVEAELRAAELSASTSIPLPFKVECSWLVEHPSACESRIHAKLAFCRVSKDREFFRINPSDAEDSINALLFGTGDQSKVFLLQLASITNLYRKYPDSFKRMDSVVSEVEAILRSTKPDA